MKKLNIKNITAMVLAGVITCTAPITTMASTDTNVSADLSAATESLENEIMSMFDQKSVEEILANPDAIADIVIAAKKIINEWNPSDEDMKNIITAALNQYSEQISSYSGIQISDSDVDKIVSAIRYAINLNLSDDEIRKYVKDIYSAMGALGIDMSDSNGILDKMTGLFSKIFG